MDSQQFDALVRAWGHRSRRGLVRGLAGAGLASALGGFAPPWLASAKRKRRKDDADLRGNAKKKKGKGKGKGKGKDKGKDKDQGKKYSDTSDPNTSGACPQGEKRCVETCVKLAFDPNHCGQCHVVCPPSHPRCDYGVCSVSSTCQSEFACAGMNCGQTPDSCGNMVGCGSCSDGRQCGTDNVCFCPNECCGNADCASGICFQGGCCPSDAQACNAAGGVQCGSLPGPICGRTVDCGSCGGGKICNNDGQCQDPCPDGKVPCGGSCTTGVCCDNRDCLPGDVCTFGGGPTTCCRPEHQSATCFAANGGAFCGTVNNNCGAPVDCGGCTTGYICAADNRCTACPADTQAVNNECCPNDSSCNSSGATFCCQRYSFGGASQQSICCGSGCGALNGQRCRSNAGCCQGVCNLNSNPGQDEFGRYGTCG